MSWHLVKVTANGENHGSRFCDFLLSLAISVWCAKIHCSRLTTIQDT